MKSLNEDLKTKQFKQMYLLYGEEGYLKKQYKNRLRNAIIDADDTMNYSYYEGKNISVPQVIDVCETLPFFSERRLIVIENSGFFKNATPQLADYVKELPETTFLVFVEDEVDKRGKLYKNVRDQGRAIELVRQDEGMLLRWIAGLVQKEKKKITKDTALYFLHKVGIDMENISQELEKLFCYTMDREVITSEDVDAICINQVTNQIFDMVSAVAQKDQRKALDYYYDLIALREDPMKILSLIARQFRLLYEVKGMSLIGTPRKDIAAKTGLPPFVVGKYESQAKAFRTKELRKILEDVISVEEAMKTSRLDAKLGVELVIIKYSAK